MNTLKLNKPELLMMVKVQDRQIKRLKGLMPKGILSKEEEEEKVEDKPLSTCKAIAESFAYFKDRSTTKKKIIDYANKLRVNTGGPINEFTAVTYVTNILRTLTSLDIIEINNKKKIIWTDAKSQEDFSDTFTDIMEDLDDRNLLSGVPHGLVALYEKIVAEVFED